MGFPRAYGVSITKSWHTRRPAKLVGSWEGHGYLGTALGNEGMGKGMAHGERVIRLRVPGVHNSINTHTRKYNSCMHRDASVVQSHVRSPKD